MLKGSSTSFDQKILPLSVDALRWKVGGSSATETQTFFVFDDLETYFFQIAFAKIGLIKTVQFTVSISSLTEGKSIFKSHSCSGTLNINKDKYGSTNEYFKIEATNKTDTQISYKLTINKKSEFEGELNFDFDVSPDAGSSIFTNLHLDKTRLVKHSFVPAGKCTGFFKRLENNTQFDFKNQQALFTRAELDTKPYSIFNACRFIIFNSKDTTFVSLSFVPPKSSKKECSVSQSFLVKDKKVQFVSTNDPIGFENASSQSYDTISGKESSFEFKDRDEKGTILFNTTLNLIQKIDVLKEIPYMIRKIINTFVTSPFIYMFLQKTNVKITIDNNETNMEGILYSETTFLN